MEKTTTKLQTDSVIIAKPNYKEAVWWLGLCKPPLLQLLWLICNMFIKAGICFFWVFFLDVLVFLFCFIRFMVIFYSFLFLFFFFFRFQFFNILFMYFFIFIQTYFFVINLFFHFSFHKNSFFLFFLNSTIHHHSTSRIVVFIFSKSSIRVLFNVFFFPFFSLPVHLKPDGSYFYPLVFITPMAFYIDFIKVSN